MAKNTSNLAPKGWYKWTTSISAKKVRFQHILHFQKHIHTSKKSKSRSSSLSTPKQPPKQSLSTITHSKNHPHPYQNQNLIIFLFFLLINNKEKMKIQAISTAPIVGQEVKFCWYNFSLYHFHFLFYSIFIILVNSSCFHHPFRIIMHYCGFWLW